jgi:hypothetical protein
MPANQANVEYWFRLVYDCFHGACYGGTVWFTEFSAWIAHLWLWVVVIGYLLAVAGLYVIIYCTVRLFELRKREEQYYTTLIAPPETPGENQRWLHIESLTGSTNPSDWRTAIIEADIMLDDVLTQQGYTGAGVGEKLKVAERSDFATLQNAWEAHKVRNQIAHQGSTFDLSETLARRTIAHYEAVFREFKAI